MNTVLNRVFIFSFILLSGIIFFLSESTFEEADLESDIPDKEHAVVDLVKGQSAASTKVNADSGQSLLNAAYTENEVIKLAYESEQCHNELSENKQLLKSQKKDLVRARLNNGKVEESLNELERAKVISFDESVSFFKQAYVDREIKDEIVKENDVFESKDSVAILDRNSNLADLLESDDESAINTWLEINLNLLDEFFIWRESGQFATVSSKIILGLYWEKLPQSSRDYILKKSNSNNLLVYGAIGGKVKPETLQKLVENNDGLNEPLLFEDGDVVDLLTISVQLENLELIDVLKKSGKFEKQQLLTPPVNKYIKDKMLADGLTESHITYLQELAKQGLIPSVNKAGVLIGTGGIRLPMELEHTIKFEVQRTVASDETETFVDPELEEWSQKKIKLDEDALRCQNLKVALVKVEPSFYPLMPDDYLAQMTNKSNAEKVAHLFDISPVLSEVFILDLISQGDTTDFAKIDSIVEGVREITPEIIQLGNQSLPHEQNYLVYKLYTSIGHKVLDIVMQNAWYIDFYKAAFLEAATGDYHQFLNDYKAVGKTSPSEMYEMIYERNYGRALELAEAFPYLNGYKFGRDSLHLLLDRVIPFRAAYINSEQKKLLDYLLSNTQLDKYHYQRLRRLKMKMPIYFSVLQRKFTQLQNVDAYEPSLYLGP
ncbi:hypothetical protein [Pseudoalteromonas sp. MMG022]|uniref:hypothetical protein n=1 Tax=Pseudoalteromonas sp. MMG022 TaxID=2909978 RepID=UPI001F3BCFDF|nr:hypothetical protein [Pseudoalteromonas sp. MMG022]MCF6436009.1 hypothetical protein [Pseudoalteromonas sp. MMG022]